MIELLRRLIVSAWSVAGVGVPCTRVTPVLHMLTDV